MGCPIKTSKEYKTLSKQVGEELATYTYMAYGDKYPKMYTNTQLRTDMNIPHKAYDSSMIALKMRIGRYNAINGTAHKYTRKKIGESHQFVIKLHPNYLTVNMEKKRQRELARKGDDRLYPGSKNVKDTSKSKEEEIVVDVVIPEMEVEVLGNNQYSAYGEIYPTYQDAIDAVEQGDDSYAISSEMKEDMNNGNITNDVLEHLHAVSGTRLSRDEFKEVAQKIVIRLQNEGFTPDQVMESLKCI